MSCRLGGGVVVLLWIGTVRADDAANGAHTEQAPEFGATASTQAPIAATNTEDATASGTTIEVRDRKRALEEVAEALIEVPGTRVLDAGGAGATSLVALRGAETGHTAVLLGAIPLSSPDSGAFDLSSLPLFAFERIEVYRGGAPVWYGEGAIGGVLRFVPEDGRRARMEATVGAGSFGRTELRTTGQASGDSGSRPAFFGHVRLLRSDNDYRYTDDGQTRFDDSDDRELTQQNADVLLGDSLMHAGVDALGGRLSFVFASHGREQGVPGPLAAPTLHVRQKLVRMLGGASYDKDGTLGSGGRRYRVQLVGSGAHQLNSVTDLYGELGLAGNLDTDDVWQRGFVRAAGSLEVLPWLEPSLVLGFAADGYDPDNSAAFSAPPRDSERYTETIAGELRFFGELAGMRAELRPSVRAAFTQSSIHGADPAQPFDDDDQDEFAPTYRLAGVIEPVNGLAISASGASGTRLPSMGELFGDRALQEANPRLEPERSNTVDGGVVVRGRVGVLRGAVEARGFALWIDDLIRFERTAQYTVRPANVASAKIFGAELGAQGELTRYFALAASLTGMHTQNQFDQQLPLRPPLQVLVRPELRAFPKFADLLALFGEVHHVAFVYLDEANLTTLPARTVLALGGSATLFAEQLTLELRVNNLLDAEITDVLSRPLPGREVRFALTLRKFP